MNFFPDQLTRELDSLETPRTSLLPALGYHPAISASFAVAKRVAAQTTISKILRNLEAESAIRVAAAWLKDQIPREVDSGAISNAPTSTRIKEENEWPDTDQELKEALIRLIKKANRTKR